MNSIESNFKKPGKIHQLETFRGFAALIVYFWHFSIGFLPDLTGFFHQGKGGIIGTPLFFLFNGTAAVVFFFVLSGFVLTQRYYQNDDLQILYQGAKKRYFRLLGPIALVVLISFWLYKLDYYFFSEAGSLSGSPWLSDFGFSGRGANLNFSLVEALKHGFYSVFILGKNDYNTSLWTITYEFFGSFLSFAVAPFLFRFNKKWRVPLIIVLIYFMNPFYLSFVAGVALAYLRSKNQLPKINPKWIWPLCLLLIFMFGAYAPVNIYHFLNHVPRWPGKAQILNYLLASVILLVLLLEDNRFTRSLSGKVGQFLGRVSFPLYLLQVPLMASFSSFFFVHFYNKMIHGFLIALLFVLTTVLLFVTSWGYSFLDLAWVKFVNRVFSSKKN